MAASILRKLVRNFPENGPKLLLENPANVRDLLALVREPAVDAIDFAAMTVERTHFVKPDFAHIALDLILKAPFHASATDKAETIWIYVLVEHQSKPQRFFPLRLMEYVLEAYKMQKRAWDEQHDSDADFFLHPVLPVVLYTGDRSWNRIDELADLVHEGGRFRGVIPRFRPHFLNLRDTPDATLERHGGSFGQILRLIQQQRTEPTAFRLTLQDVMTRLEKMPTVERSRWADFLSYALALVYHARNENEHHQLREIVDRSVQTDPHRKEYDKMGRTIAEMFMDQGEVRGKREVLLRLLRRRFKKVPREMAACIAAATDVHDLDKWLDRIVDAKTLNDVGIE